MSLREELIPLSDRQRWEEALSRIDHAFGHTWASCHAMHATTGHDTYLYHYREGGTNFVCPIAERSFRGATDVVTPYGFSGFAGRGDKSQLMESWSRFARRRGYVAGYIALNPLLVGEGFAGADGLSYGNELFFLDLSRSEEDLLGTMKRGRRRPIRRWQLEGSPLETDRERLAVFFAEHFARFMQSRGAGPAYRFDAETLRRLVHSPGAFLLGAPSEGELEAVTLFCQSPAIGEAMFSVSSGEGGRHADVLMWAGALELKRRGVRWLSLGGGIARGDGVARLKEGYGGLSLRMPVLRQIYDRDRFDRACVEAGLASGGREGYFPPWHKAANHVH